MEAFKRKTNKQKQAFFSFIETHAHPFLLSSVQAWGFWRDRTEDGVVNPG